MKRSAFPVVLAFALSLAAPLLAPMVAYGEEPPAGLEAVNSDAEGTYELIDNPVNGSAVPMALSSSPSVSFVELGGATRYETAAEQALYARPSSPWAIVASGESYVDSLAAAGLAGALDCPILLTQSGLIPSATTDALSSMGVRNIIILGGTTAVSSSVELALGQYGSVTRLGGETRYDTQIAIYHYGIERGYWRSGEVFVASGVNFADALSVSPLSYALKVPVFFVNESGTLPSHQYETLSRAGLNKAVVLGGTDAVSESAYQQVSQLVSRQRGSISRLGGATRYETSAEVARYAVSSCGFSWDGLAFSSGVVPFDSLGGGVVQGQARSVLLLATEDNHTSASSVPSGAVASCVKFFGGQSVFSRDARRAICSTLGLVYYPNTTFRSYPIALSSMAQLQADKKTPALSTDEFKALLDPTGVSHGTAAYLRFALLNQGYSGLSAGNLDTYISKNCIYQESAYKCSSALRGLGSTFVRAAQVYGVNEAYLLSHATLESAWGCSDLAQGWTPTEDGVVTVNGVRYPYKKNTTYYNFYGIGAVDSGPLTGGRAMAVKEGWTTPDKAIMGAAQWISKNYLNRSYAQNTLYLMRYDVAGAAATGSVYHEYCTSTTWVDTIASNILACYRNAGYVFDDLPLKYEIPLYADM